SDRHDEIAGSKASEFIGKTPASTGSHWIDEATERAAKEAMDARRPYTNLRKRFTAADGVLKTIMLSARPRFAERGRFQGCRGTVHDITEQQRMEEELRKSRDRLVRAQRMGRIGSGEVDLTSNAAIWSDEMYAMMGFDREGGTGADRYVPFVHPDD